MARAGKGTSGAGIPARERSEKTWEEQSPEERLQSRLDFCATNVQGEVGFAAPFTRAHEMT
jgi:hypothetical protein